MILFFFKFDGSLLPKDLLPFLQAESGVTITSETLLIFDEENRNNVMWKL